VTLARSSEYRGSQGPGVGRRWSLVHRWTTGGVGGGGVRGEVGRCSGDGATRLGERWSRMMLLLGDRSHNRGALFHSIFLQHNAACGIRRVMT
jgi:hypothetical protein